MGFHHRRHLISGCAENALRHRGATRVVGDIGIGGKVYVEAVVAQIAADVCCDASRVVGVACCAYLAHIAHVLHREIGVACDASYGTSLFVYAQKGGKSGDLAVIGLGI